MHDDPENGMTNIPLCIPGPVRHLLWGIIVLCVIFAALIVVIPLPLYRLIGNSFEVVAAFFCMCVCLYAYRHWSGRVILLLAAFAFGEYALATVFWYLFTLLPLTVSLGRPFVFTSVAELSFFGFMLFFIAGFQIEGKKEPVSRMLTLAPACAVFNRPADNDRQIWHHAPDRDAARSVYRC